MESSLRTPPSLSSPFTCDTLFGYAHPSYPKLTLYVHGGSYHSVFRYLAVHRSLCSILLWWCGATRRHNMYRRKSTASSNVGRSKSDASMGGVRLQHIGHDTAEQHAHAAASRAFSRARDRSTTEPSVWPPTRTESTTSAAARPSLSSNLGRPSRSDIRRQHSLRFCRSRSPTAANPRDGHSSVYAPRDELRRGTSLSRVGHRQHVGSPSGASASGMISAMKGTAGDYINDLFMEEQQYCTPEDDIASEPSSYRRLRKSKSMFTPGNGRRYGTDLPRHHITTSQSQSWFSSNSFAGLGARTVRPPGPAKSVSYLRSRQHRSDPVSTYHSTQMHQLDVCTPGPSKTKLLRSRSSTFFSTKLNNNTKSFSKTMRLESQEHRPSSDDAAPSKTGSLRNKARKVSSQVRRGIRNIFTTGREGSDVCTLPPQHVEARASHNASPALSTQYLGSVAKVNTVDVECSVSQVASGVPSLHAIPSQQQLRSRHGSVESLRSNEQDADEKSRVTSWTNSETNTHSTVASNRSEHDRQRLSVINEHGMHVSSSADTKQCSDVVRSGDQTAEQVLTPRTARVVDGPRLFSALMKRVDSSSPTGRKSATETSSRSPSSSSRALVKDQYSSSTQQGTTTDKASTATIRRVKNLESTVHKDASVQHALSETRRRTGPKHPDATAPPGLRCSKSAHPIDNSSSGNASDSAQQVEKGSQSRTLSSRSSAFFGSPTNHLFRTKSPYRKALQASMQTADSAPGPKSPEYNPWMRSLTDLPLRCPSVNSEGDEKMHYTDSIYSEETDDQPRGYTNIMSIVEQFPKPPTSHGDATIFVNSPTPMPSQARRPSARVPSEWKAWVTANLSELDRVGLPAVAATKISSLATQPAGHVRENAQIEDDEPLEEGLCIREGTASATSTPNHVQRHEHLVSQRTASHSAAPTVTNNENRPPTKDVESIDQKCLAPSDDFSSLSPHDASWPHSAKAIPTAERRTSGTTDGRKARPSNFSVSATDIRAELGTSIDRQFGALLAADRQFSIKRPYAIILPKIAAPMQDFPKHISPSRQKRSDLQTNPNAIKPVSPTNNVVQSRLQARRHRLASSEDDGSVFL